MQKRYTAAVFTVKTPLYFCLMRICEGNFRTEEQKNGSPEIPFDKSELNKIATRWPVQAVA